MTFWAYFIDRSSHIEQLPVYGFLVYKRLFVCFLNHIFLIFQKTDTKAHTPKFPKPKDEGWFLVIGDVESKELVALKRVPCIRSKSTVQMAVYMPETTGRVIYTVYLMSDSYLGLDQQYDICLDVIPQSLESQVNTELKDALDDLDFDS